MSIKYVTLPELTAQQVNNFWNKVEIQPNGCWEWQGYKTKSGYGRITLTKRNSFRAHRVAYKIYYLQDPQEFYVCHTCDNPCCVNPFHLWLGTSADNAKDRNDKGRQADISGKKHYSFTHPEKVCRGEQRGGSKATAQNVLDIRKAFADGENQRSIARRFNVSPHVVFHIVHRKTWTHI